MRFIHFLALGFFLGNISCTIFRGGYRYSKSAISPDFLVIGHRGEAGNLPENSIWGFLSAVEKGVDALEMDVVISGDKKVVVSHEPFMASHYVLDPDGKPIPQKKESENNFYEMEYETIKKFESGLKKNKDFPKQKKISSYKPLLEEVIQRVEDLTAEKGLKPVIYMVEIKSSPENYHRSQPGPTEFSRLVMNVIENKGIAQRSIIKSFDPVLLNRVHELYPQVKISYLVSKKGIRKNLSRLNFTPDYYSPRHRLIVDRSFVDSVKTMNMKLLPWTVNRKRKIRRLLELGVDGIITDYPERALQLREKLLE